MSEFRRSINEFQVNLRLFSIECGGEERVSKDKSSLSNTDGATFKHHVVIKDASVMRETSEGGDILLSDISFSSGVYKNMLKLFILLSLVSLADLPIL